MESLSTARCWGFFICCSELALPLGQQHARENTKVTQTVSTVSRLVFGSARRVLLPLLIVGLVVSNIASVVSERFHEALFGAVSTVATIAGTTLAGKLMANSLQTRKQVAIDSATRDVQKRLALQTSKLQDLERQHSALNARHGDLQKRNTALVEARRMAALKTQELAARSKARLARTVARNTGALAGEAVPALGLVVAVGVTALDVVDACETLKDWNASLAAQDQAPLDTASVCGVRVPSSKEVLAGLTSTWRQSAELVSAELASMQLAIERPIASVPKATQLKEATCPVVKLVGLCN
jgi:hypothetical protein